MRRRMYGFDDGKLILTALFISYFLYLITSGIGVMKYSENRNLNLVQNKFKEIEDKHKYMLENIYVGDIENNNREIIFLEESMEDILDKVKNEGAFWLVDLKKLIDEKESKIIKSCFEGNAEYKDNINYLKLKNEVEDYNFYYKIKEKPIDYIESPFFRYFTSIFNSRFHQIFLTSIVIGICITLVINNENIEYSFFKSLLLTSIPVILMQISNLFLWGFISNKINLFYPVRILGTDYIKSMIDFGEVGIEKVIPFYKIIILVILFQFFYIACINGVIKIITLVTNTKAYTFVLGFFSLCILIVGSFTKFSSYSFLSYGKFFDVVRGYESIYRNDKLLNLNMFFIFLLAILGFCFIIYLYKRYVLEEYI